MYIRDGASHTYLTALRLLQCCLHHVLVRLLHPAHPEVNPWSHLLNFHSRQPLPALPRLDQVHSHVDLRFRVRCALLAYAEADHVLQPLHIHTIDIRSLKEVQQHTLRQRILVVRRALE